MCSKTPLNILIEKMKPRGRGSDDELAIVKAAAWAWYQHSAGSEGKLLREFDAIRRPQAPRPSKYKLEAKRFLEETKGSGSSLLDTHEIVSISKRLDECIIESRVNPLHQTCYVEDILLRQESWWSHSACSSGSSSSSIKRRLDMKFLNGFLGQTWKLIACGRREDVDTRALLSIRKRHVPMVKMVTSRQWLDHA